MTGRARPLLRWHGGKWRLAPWIMEHFPPHRVYVEPFGGGASVLLRKPRSYSEVYNDLDEDVVNLFRVLRSDQAAELVRVVTLTPFSRTEFFDCYEISDDPVERARRLIVRAFMGFGSDGHNIEVKTGFRANANRSHTVPAHDWMNYPPALQVIIERLRGVVVECRPAIEVIAQQDTPYTLFYVDPPYLPETRSGNSRSSGGTFHAYAHEMSADDHRELLARLREVKGMVVLSGYPAPMYDEMLTGWKRLEKAALADGARPRTEIVWINPAAGAADLFGSAG